MLDDFLRHEAQTPFVWGLSDCCSTADRWVKFKRGFSPLERYGRTYASEEEAKAWLAESGGIIMAVAKVMKRNGINRTVSPKAGDVGIVAVQDMRCMAIFNGWLWVSRSQRGWASSMTHCHYAWSVC